MKELQPLMNDFCDKHNMPRVKVEANVYESGLGADSSSNEFKVRLQAMTIMGARNPRETLAMLGHELTHAEQAYLLAKRKWPGRCRCWRDFSSR